MGGLLTAVASLVWSVGSGARAPGAALKGSVAVDMGSVALQHVASFQTRDKPVSPALAGECLTLGPPRRSSPWSLIWGQPLSHTQVGLSDCLSPWAVSSVRVRTVCISLMGSTAVPGRQAEIIHQGVSPFMPSDEISQTADLFLTTDQESLDDSLCWLSCTCSLSPRKKRRPGLFCWVFWADLVPAVGSNHRRRECGRRARSGRSFLPLLALTLCSESSCIPPARNLLLCHPVPRLCKLTSSSSP